MKMKESNIGKGREKWRGVLAVMAVAIAEVFMTGCKRLPYDIQLLMQRQNENFFTLKTISEEINKSDMNKALLEGRLQKCREGQEVVNRRSRQFYGNRSEMLQEVDDCLRIGPALLLRRPSTFYGKGLMSSYYVVSKKAVENKDAVELQYYVPGRRDREMRYINDKGIVYVTEDPETGKKEKLEIPVQPYASLGELPLNTGTKDYWVIADLQERPLDFDLDVKSVEILFKGTKIDEIGIASLDQDGNGRYFIEEQMIYPFKARGNKITWGETGANGVYLLKVDFSEAFGYFRLKAGKRWAVILPSGAGNDQVNPRVPCDYLGTGNVCMAEFDKETLLKSGMKEISWIQPPGQVITQGYLLGAEATDANQKQAQSVRKGLSVAITFGLYGLLPK